MPRPAESPSPATPPPSPTARASNTCSTNSTASAASICPSATNIRNATRAGTSPPSAPPLEIVARRPRRRIPAAQRARRSAQRSCSIRCSQRHPHWDEFALDGASLRGRLKPLPALFPEEERSKQPSAFSILRALLEEFRNPLDSHLALVGAFGYDLLFQFDPIELKLPRDGHKDLHLFLCDDIYFMDRKKEQIERFRYDFARGDLTTAGLARTGARIPKPRKRPPQRDHLRPHARRIHGQGRSRARRHAPGRLLRGGAAPDLPGQFLRESFGTVRAHPARQPESLRIFPAARRRSS